MDSSVVSKMESLEIEEQAGDPWAKISGRWEIIEEILLNLPVKSLFRFKSVSTEWRNTISDPSFAKRHFTRAKAANRSPLFITAYNTSTKKLHFLSGAPDGGPLTCLITLDAPLMDCVTTDAQHLNGLLLYTCVKYSEHATFYTRSEGFVVNPSMCKMFKLPEPFSISFMNFSYSMNCSCYLSGFDESRSEHKILIFGKPFIDTHMIEVMIFSLPTTSWRTIETVLPSGYKWDDWRELGCPLPLEATNEDEIIFSPSRMLRSHLFSVPIYNSKSRRFKSVQYTLGHQLMGSDTMWLNKITCYVENMMSPEIDLPIIQ